MVYGLWLRVDGVRFVVWGIYRVAFSVWGVGCWVKD